MITKYRIGLLLCIICYLPTFGQVLQKKNILKIGTDFLYIPDWAGHHPLLMKNYQAYDRYIYKGLYATVVHEFARGERAMKRENILIPINRIYSYWSIGLGYSFYLSASRKWKINAQTMLSRRDRIYNAYEKPFFNGTEWEGTGNVLRSKNTGIIPSLHLVYNPLTWLNVNVDIAYALYKKDTKVHYLQKENNFMGGISLGYQFGNSR